MLQQAKTASFTAAKSTAKSIITWAWVKRLLHWLIISAGTISECAFLIASLWMSVNASVHSLVLLFVTEQTAQHLTELATAAYVALPELILGLAFVVTIGHVRLWLYNKRNYSAAIWSVLYGLPTVVFLVLSLVTLGSSVASVNFRLPTELVVVRALAGYMFAFTSLLYTQLGTPQERDRLQKKDDLLTQLSQEKDAMQQELNAEIARIQQTLTAEIARIKSELDAVYKEKETAIQEKTMLYSALTQSSEDALQAYGDTVIEWLNSLDKTVDVDDIAAHTGMNKRRLQNAIDKGELRIRGTNKGRVWVPSLREYLTKNAPKSQSKEQETGPILRIVNG